ncbi:PP2C family protein-serine/threonine phosphatase [Streptomyces sp. NPDC101118]|uniref:PP2C family protein-serine/threonine phosphatase n=1 Tax=Streptomyces sp. NPDC101118 TaxID=3366109 RepID=UPI00381865A2
MSAEENCTACGGTVAPDGHCWDCGTRRPAHRARLEAGSQHGAAGVSDRGRVKGVNADAMALVTAGEWTVGTVCDGVSMTPRAERAATLAAEVGARVLAVLLTEGRLPEDALETSARRAGRAVAALAAPAAGPGPDPAGDPAPACTYVAAAVGPQGVWCGWLGDSRAYWLPDRGTAFRLTEDDQGADGALTAWLGADAEDTPAHVRSYRPREPGTVLLCTDGLTRYLADPVALAALPPAGGDPLPRARALVDHALRAGGADNVTVLLLPAPGSGTPPQGA